MAFTLERLDFRVTGPSGTRSRRAVSHNFAFSRGAGQCSGEFSVAPCSRGLSTLQFYDLTFTSMGLSVLFVSVARPCTGEVRGGRCFYHFSEMVT